MNQEKEIEEMAKELHCATNESFISCRKIARILVERRGYRLCGGEDCPNFKHYQAECERCTQTMEVKKSLEIESAAQQAVKEFAGNIIELLDEMGMERSSEYNDGYDDGVADCITNIKSLITELYGEDE